MSEGFEGVSTRADRYDLDGVLPVDDDLTVPEGTAVLVSGPSMLGKRDIALSMLAHGDENGEPVVIITPDDGTERILRSYRNVNPDPENVYVVDCSGTSNRSSFDDTRNEYYVSGPDDLTGVGIGLVKSTRAMGETGEDGVRVALLSVSTLLRYSSVKRVFNFLHVMTNRFAAAGYLGVATFNPTVHDEQTANLVRSLFDCVVDVRETDAGDREARVRGLPDVSREWRSL